MITFQQTFGVKLPEIKKNRINSTCTQNKMVSRCLKFKSKSNSKKKKKKK